MAIMLEVLRTTLQYVIAFLGLRPVQLTALRMRLGQSMVIGLEFLVAADILKTALSPTWNDILLLAALIALRTILNYLLEHELKMDIVSNYVLEQSLTSWDWTKMLSSVRLDIPIPFKLKESNNDKCKRNKAKAPESYSYVAPSRLSE